MKTINSSAAPGGTKPSREQLSPATAAPGTLSLVPAAASVPFGDDALLGEQLTAQYKKAITATREVVVFGAMMLKIRQNLPTRGEVSGGRGHTGGLSDWLRTYAPDVASGTAYRFMALAEGVQEEFQLGKKVDLTLLLTESADELTPALRKKQKKILDFLEGKSQRQLLLQLGGDDEKKKPSKKKDEELTPEEEFDLVHGRIKTDANTLMDGIEAFTSKKYFQIWNDAELDHAAKLIAEAADAVEAWRKMPKGKRLATAVQDEIRAWKGTSK